MKATFAKWYRKFKTNVFGEEYVGATEEWQFKKEVKKAGKAMLPFDDVDEWLAVRLREYDKALVKIENMPRNSQGHFYKYGKSVRQTFSAFVQKSLRSHFYRQIDLPTAFTKRDTELLKVRLSVTPVAARSTTNRPLPV